jgi:hypothetical protein
VITPRVLGERLGISPPWVLIALMVGAELYGLLGVMFALPVAAVLKVFLTHGVTRYRSSPVFADGAAAAGAEGAVGGPSASAPPVRARRVRRRRGPIRGHRS